jgi:membrane fusion protein (multidrug efflux system)
MNYHQTASTKLLLTVLLLNLWACDKKQSKVVAPPDIQVMNVIQQDVPIYKEFVGQVYGLQDIPIRARVEGYLEGIHFEEGRPVKKGQLLYTIDSQPFLADEAAYESKVAEAQTYLVNAENELARYKPLAEINAVSKSDLDAAQASRDAAEASLDAAKANLRLSRINLSYTTIKSPISGLIGKTEARVGEFVGREPNPVILNMVSNIENTRVQFFITESDYIALVKEIQNESTDGKREEERGSGTFELILSDGQLYENLGVFDFIDRNVDVSTGSIMIQALFPNPKGLLRPGMYAKVRVKFETVKNGLLVPQRSITELQGQYSVYIVDNEGVVQARQIKVGEKIGDLWLITDGLSAKDQVVYEGLQKVRSEMQVNPQVVEYSSKSNQ